MATITLPAHLESLTRGLAFVVDCATAEGFPPRRITEIELAVEEALVNICQYAYPDRTGEVEVRCARDETPHFLIEIVDTGVHFDLLSVPTVNFPADPTQLQIGGLGIPLILALVDRVTYHRNGTQNILQLAVRLPLCEA